MNRKMRAKLNNAEARRKQDCPQWGKTIMAPLNGDHKCGDCGEELERLPTAITIVDGSSGESTTYVRGDTTERTLN